jgi:glutamate-ammonia-ligase adenylyltransferase
VQQRLLRLLGLARWPMRYLMQHPAVIDELADERQIAERFDRAAFTSDLDERHTAWVRAGEADEGELLDTLRRAHHAETFRTLVRDVEQRITIEQAADDLSALADAIVDCCIRWAWAHLKQRHRDEPQFAVIAYGKLGGWSWATAATWTWSSSTTTTPSPTPTARRRSTPPSCAS